MYQSIGIGQVLATFYLKAIGIGLVGIGLSLPSSHIKGYIKGLI